MPMTRTSSRVYHVSAEVPVTEFSEALVMSGAHQMGVNVGRRG